MREIKFRAWDKVRKKMYYIDGVKNCLTFESHGGDGTWSQFSRQEGYAFSTTDSLNAILMQFTGLLDKSGKEIYEGDVIKVESDVTSEVSFKDGEFINKKSGWGLHIYISPKWKGQAIHQMEIIGNIYENPELIKT